MKGNATSQSAFLNLRVLIGLFVLLTGVFWGLPGLGAFSNASAATSLNGSNPVVVNVTLITGAETRVPGPAHAAVRIADLGPGFAAGIMRYVFNGINMANTYAPFLWSEKYRSATLFKLPDFLARTRSTYIPNAMTPDASTVVGSVIFLDAQTTAPWLWRRKGGLKFLELPSPFAGGGAVAVSKHGRLVAGIVVDSSSRGQAAVWRDGVFETLRSSQPWSEVGSTFETRQPLHQHPMNRNGSIIVGASGPVPDQMQATRWVDGVEQPLPTGQATSSVAMFVTDKGVIFGTAALGDGRVVMMRWDSGGNLEILEPPRGLSVVNLSSIDKGGTVAGGALAQSTSCIGSKDPACNWAPFVWSASPNGLRGGVFTILPEAGLEDYYNLSTVNDVSDDGRVAVGSLAAAIRADGDPPAVGFLWTEESGLVLVNDIMAQGQPDYHSADRVSRDGNRVLVTGNPPQATERDTTSLILDLRWPARGNGFWRP